MGRDGWRAGGALAGVVLALLARSAPAQDLPRGTIVEGIACRDDPSETYALYLPSDYTGNRAWSLLLAFHPGARGEAMVALYRDAAERFGYVVVGSTTSRNGPWDAAARAVRAVSRDVARRFTIDAERVYLTGHSGGARLALEVALGPNDIAGVIASSAGFADTRPRRTVPFALFATAGRDDFNYRELRALDAALTSPHALAVFEGGHALPPPAVALEGLAWLELQAMRAGRRTRDAALVERWFEERRRAADAEADPAVRVRRLRAIVADFEGLRETAGVRALTETLARDPRVAAALAADRLDLTLEERALNDALDQESRLRHPEERGPALARLTVILAAWATTAGAPTASPERSRARRLLGGLAAGAAGRVSDPDYLALVRKHRWQE